MSRRWTRKERREHLKEKYFKVKEKLFVIIMFTILFIILLYSLYASFQSQAHPLIIALLMVAILVLIPIAIFAIDLVVYEFE